MIRVLVAEDSRTIRELMVSILERDSAVTVVGQAVNGQEAIELAARLKPDLITMDIHMPILDGLAATREIMALAPTPIIIVSSSTSQGASHLAFDAMQAGALLVLPKPGDPQSPRFDGRGTQLVVMAKAMSQVKVVRRWPQKPSPVRPAALLPMDGAAPRLVTIAASTGGPAVLQRILGELPRDFPVPILVVQHIATGFIGGLAGWLNSQCRFSVHVAEHHELTMPGRVLVAPDDRHLGISPDGRVVLADSAPIGGFRPSATYLFDSAARAFGSSVAAVILTGMGSDGVEGLKAVKAAGGRVLAQDEASSIVYGMPGEAVAAGVVDAILPADRIARRLLELANAGRPRS